jgi:hypothetical protein
MTMIHRQISALDTILYMMLRTAHLAPRFQMHFIARSKHTSPKYAPKYALTQLYTSKFTLPSKHLSTLPSTLLSILPSILNCTLPSTLPRARCRDSLSSRRWVGCGERRVAGAYGGWGMVGGLNHDVRLR